MSSEFQGRGIIWPHILAPEDQRRSNVALENGEWILRDGENRIYDRH